MSQTGKIVSSPGRSSLLNVRIQLFCHVRQYKNFTVSYSSYAGPNPKLRPNSNKVVEISL